MTDDQNRRRILASLGGISAILTGTAGAQNHEETAVNVQDGCQEHGEAGRIYTRSCDDREAAQTHDETAAGEDWSDGVVTIHNCENCRRDVYIRVSGELGEDRYLYTDEVEDLSPSATVAVPPGERRTVWFTGHLSQVATDEGDLNIAISQRFPDDANVC